MEQKFSHDRLLSECFLWMWNTYPQTRWCCFHVRNENKELSAQKIRTLLLILAKFLSIFISSEKIEAFIKHYKSHPDVIKQRMIDGSIDKATGIVSGVLDLIWYCRIMYCFDVKIGNDKLSEAQLRFIAAIEKQGGKCFVISSLQQFKEIVITLINGGTVGK